MPSPLKQKGHLARHRPGDVLSRMQRAWGESPFYQARLKGPAPDRLLFQLDDPYTPDKDFAASFAEGRLCLGAESIDCEGELERLWDLAEPGQALNAFLQEFTWLRHLEALGASGRPVAKALTKAWLDRFEKWSADAWAPYFVSERLVQLCAHHPLVLSKTDALWRSRVLSSMARQTRHLACAAHRADTGFDRLMTALGLCVAGYCLPGCDGSAERGIEMARRELRLQLRADGGHVSRNPSRQLMLAIRLQMVSNAIEARGIQAPGFLRHTIARVNTMASFFRCGDGRLAVFNGGYEDDGRAVLAIQKTIDAESALTGFARHSGYHKMSAVRALVIVDTSDDNGARCYKSAGSVHFSSGRSRVFGNCGNGGHRAHEWGKALEQRGAHSSVSFDDKLETPPIFGASTIRRAEDSKGQLIEIEREMHSLGQTGVFSRRLFLAAGGNDFRGEEFGLPPEILSSAVWRFHLHPAVRASLARDRRSIILLLPNKEGWRFKSNCPSLILEKSIYCGDGGAPVASEQIALHGSAYVGNAKEITVKWALRRLDVV